MKRKTVRWVIGAAAGLIASTSIASGTAQAAAPTDLAAGLLPAGLGQMVPAGAVTGLLPAGQ